MLCRAVCAFPFWWFCCFLFSFASLHSQRTCEKRVKEQQTRRKKSFEQSFSCNLVSSLSKCTILHQIRTTNEYTLLAPFHFFFFRFLFRAHTRTLPRGIPNHYFLLLLVWDCFALKCLWISSFISGKIHPIFEEKLSIRIGHQRISNILPPTDRWYTSTERETMAGSLKQRNLNKRWLLLLVCFVDFHLFICNFWASDPFNQNLSAARCRWYLHFIFGLFFIFAVPETLMKLALLSFDHAHPCQLQHFYLKSSEIAVIEIKLKFHGSNSLRCILCKWTAAVYSISRIFFRILGDCRSTIN